MSPPEERPAGAPDVLVVGAGLAGLRCAIELSSAGRTVQVLEGADEVGGRMRTDRVDGFLLDRGFQVLNDAYPAARQALDLTALRLQRLEDAMVVHRGGRLYRLGNPLARPSQALGLLGTGVLGWGQKARIGAYAAAATVLPARAIRGRDDISAREAWRRAGLDPDAVLAPFFQGVVLEREMATSRRFLDLMLRMFVRGRSTLPERGMQAVPEHLAGRLPPGTVRLGCAVETVGNGQVLTGSGPRAARAVVVATDPWTAHRLLPDLGTPPVAHGVTTVYHAAPVWPGQHGTLITDADQGPVANTVVVSVDAPAYAPSGRALVATSLLHGPDGPPDVGEPRLLAELSTLHQTDATGWERLATYDIPRALPAMPAPHDFRRPVRVGPGLYVAGDHRDTSSIQGALVSGRRVAEAVLRDLA